jgi:hypothetical protein
MTMVWRRLVVGSIALAAGMSACTGHARGGSAGTRPEARPAVAWVNRPATPETPPTTATTAPVVTGRPCHSSDVTIGTEPGGAAAGNYILPVTFTNRSSSPCVLDGYPSVAGVAAGGRPVPLDAAHGSFAGDPGPPAPIGKGETAQLYVSTGDACVAAQAGHHTLYPTLRFTLPGGGSIDLVGADFDTVCGIDVSRFGVPAFQTTTTTVPVSPLTATLSLLPATVRPGQTLSYTVTLANRSDAPYSLNPCPAYEEGIGVVGGDGSVVPVVANYFLNCLAVHAIAPHAAVVFAMRLDVPASTPGGTAKFGWHLHGESGPSAAGVLRVGG